MSILGRILITLILAIPFVVSSAVPPTRYIQVTANKGMGVYGLLRKYQLLDRSENLEKFYELNKMKPGGSLIQGKSYLLPILSCKFDGKSIRSTLKIEDYQKAKELQAFNEDMVEAKIKIQSYYKDKTLWVPEHFIDTKIKDTNKKNSGEQSKTKDAINTAEKSKNVENSFTTKVFHYELIADAKLDHVDNGESLVNRSPITEADDSSMSESMVKKVSNKMLTVNLFGPKAAEVPVESEELKDQVFYIVPGHGGPDPGAMFKDKDSEFTFCEDEYAYDVSLRLARNLLTKGAMVYVIVQDKNDGIRDDRYLDCDDDEKCIGGHEMPVNQLKRLRQGMIKTNQLYLKHQLEGLKKQWMISIHIDSQPEENRQDVFFYYQSESKTSKKKAKDLKSVFSTKYKKYQGRDYNGTISARPLYVVRTSEADPIFIELANIRNAQDRERIASPRNRQLLADWIMEGFL